jgi:type VI secretion system protein ImpJ
MSWTNRVVWQEGMFLRAQHFQQQDRSLDEIVRARISYLRAHGWGLAEYGIDKNLLETGRFALVSGAGLFEDGTPFAIPGESDHPPPLEVPPSTRNAIVYLSLPIRQSGAVEVALNGEAEGRYVVHPFEAYDTHSGAPQPANLVVGRLRLRYMLETEDRAGWTYIGVARIVEVLANRRVVLDEAWVPPALFCAAAPALAGFVVELAGVLNQSGDELGARITAPGSRGVAEVSDFLMLQSINRWQKLLSHWTASGTMHPEHLYEALVQMAGEFATYVETTRRPSNYPAYRQEDLQQSFAPVIADLRRYLAAPREYTAVSIPLVPRGRSGVRVGEIADRSMLANCSFVLAVRADVPSEMLRRMFPTHVHIGAVEQISNLVNVAVSGIAVRPLPVAPRQIPYHAGATYFELEKHGPHWQYMQSSAGFAVHLQDEPPNLHMELWAIRA